MVENPVQRPIKTQGYQETGSPRGAGNFPLIQKNKLRFSELPLRKCFWNTHKVSTTKTLPSLSLQRAYVQLSSF